MENQQLSESSERSFFLVVAPGLVSLAEREVHDKWPGIISLAEEIYQTKFFTEPELTAEPAGLTRTYAPQVWIFTELLPQDSDQDTDRVSSFVAGIFQTFNRTRKN